jgi:hypothetical protein
MQSWPNAIQVNNDYDQHMKTYIAIVFFKVEITSSIGYVPNDFLEPLVQSHNSNGMCISVVCNQVEVSFGGQSEELHIQGIC